MDRNKLAVLANELGGYDEIERELGIPAELAQKAVEGDPLSGYENAILETGFNKLYLEDDRGLDLENLFGSHLDKFGYETNEGTVTGALDLAERFIADSDLQDKFREFVAEGRINVDDLTPENIGLFANLTPHQAEMIIEGIENGTADARSMFDAYTNDEFDFWDIEDSDFWEWFREVFYGEGE